MDRIIRKGDILAYYAVKKGKNIGIYSTWAECESQVKGFSGAIYKKFKTHEEANRFIADNENETKNSFKDEMEEKGYLEDIPLEDGQVIAYVDGSFDLDTFTYSYGVVYITNRGKRTYSGRESDEELAEMRNVSGELRGAMEAMKIAVEEGKDSLYLHYDYKGIEEWAKGRWKTNKSGTRKYKEFYEEIKEKLDVIFIKVEAHAGIKYNEEADKLAKEAL